MPGNRPGSGSLQRFLVGAIPTRAPDNSAVPARRRHVVRTAECNELGRDLGGATAGTVDRHQAVRRASESLRQRTPRGGPGGEPGPSDPGSWARNGHLRRSPGWPGRDQHPACRRPANHLRTRASHDRHGGPGAARPGHRHASGGARRLSSSSLSSLGAQARRGLSRPASAAAPGAGASASSILRRQLSYRARTGDAAARRPGRSGRAGAGSPVAAASRSAAVHPSYTQTR